MATCFRRLLACAAAALACAPAPASPILVDWSPAALHAASTHGNEYRNIRASQHFGERVSFGLDTLVDGIDIYAAAAFGSPGTQVAITIWNDDAGRPGAIAGQFDAVLSAIDRDGATAGNVRKHADFDGFTMLADTAYWIGMAGKTTELAQTALLGVDGGDGLMAQFSNFKGYTGHSIVGDMAFRLYGTASNQVIELPEPGSLSLACVAGVALLAAQLRRSRRALPV